MWARDGDFYRCLGKPTKIGPPVKDEGACRRIYWTYYLWPRLQKEIEQLLATEKKPPIPVPEPGPLTPAGQLSQEIASVVVGQLLGEPNPQPSISAAVRLEATKGAREALANFVKQLDEEAEQLAEQLP